MYKTEYICINADKKLWYYYNSYEHRWNELTDAMLLRRKLSVEVYGQYKTDEQRDQAVAESSQQSVEQARQNAYANLIQYLGKDQAQLADLINQFVLVDLKVNTQTSNPDNQKTIFAIKADGPNSSQKLIPPRAKCGPEIVGNLSLSPQLKLPPLTIAPPIAIP